MKNLLLKKTDVTDITEVDYESVDVDINANSYARLGWIIVIFGVLGFLLWASIAPLNSGVPLSGTVSAATSRKAIQHQTGGIIEEILVKEGDVVKAGQVLIRMNDTTAKTNAEIARIQLYSVLSTEARLIAEQSKAGQIKFPQLLIKNKGNPAVSDAMSLQQQLFTVRQGSLRSEISALEENIIGMNLQLVGLKESMVNKKEQAKSMKEQVESMRDLAKDGFIPKNRILEIERSYSQINSAVSEDLGNIGRVTGQIAELKIRIIQRQQTYFTEVSTQLSEVQREVASLTSRLSALEFELSTTNVKAPVDGTVVTVNVFTNGGVVPAAYKMMEMVPSSDPLIIEGSLPVNMVDKIHKGLPVELMFSAFNTNTTPHIPGVVTHIGADRVVDEHTGQPYYKFRAEVTPEGVKLLGKHEVRAGMPVELFVKTGERTMMNYLLKPLLDRRHTAMKED